MEALVAILLGGIDIVRHTTWALLERVGESRVDAKAHILLGISIAIGEDDTDIVLAIGMLKVATACLDRKSVV